MKTNHLIKTVSVLITLVTMLFIPVTKAQNMSYILSGFNTDNKKPTYILMNMTNLDEINLDAIAQLKNTDYASEKAEEIQKEQEEKTKIVYDGMTLEQLGNKLNRSLHSTISGKGHVFAKYAVDLGIDPYMAVAIVMHETGCKWTCSSLMRTCNNVGGMKGGSSTKCNGGSYASFPSLDAGIKAFMNNLYKNYISKGLRTPEAMASKYAASSSWATNVRKYMSEIKAR